MGCCGSRPGHVAIPATDNRLRGETLLHMLAVVPTMDASPEAVTAALDRLVPPAGTTRSSPPPFIDPFGHRCLPYTVVVDTLFPDDGHVQGSGLVVQYRTGMPPLFKSEHWWLLTAASNVARLQHDAYDIVGHSVTVTMLHGMPGCAPETMRGRPEKVSFVEHVAVMQLHTTRRQRKGIVDRVQQLRQLRPLVSSDTGLPPCLRDLLYACGSHQGALAPASWHMVALGYPARQDLRCVSCVVQTVHCDDEDVGRAAFPPGMVVTPGMQGALVMDVSYVAMGSIGTEGRAGEQAVPSASREQSSRAVAVPPCYILGDAAPGVAAGNGGPQRVAAVHMLPLHGLRQVCWDADKSAVQAARDNAVDDALSGFAFSVAPTNRCNWQVLPGCRGAVLHPLSDDVFDAEQWLVFDVEQQAMAARLQCARHGLVTSAVYPSLCQRNLYVPSLQRGLWVFVEPGGLGGPGGFRVVPHGTWTQRRPPTTRNSDTDLFAPAMQRHMVVTHGLLLSTFDLSTVPGFLHRAGVCMGVPHSHVGLVCQSKRTAQLAVFPLLQAASWVGPVQKVDPQSSGVDECVRRDLGPGAEFDCPSGQLQAQVLDGVLGRQVLWFLVVDPLHCVNWHALHGCVGCIPSPAVMAMHGLVFDSLAAACGARGRLLASGFSCRPVIGRAVEIRRDVCTGDVVASYGTDSPAVAHGSLCNSTSREAVARAACPHYVAAVRPPQGDMAAIVNWALASLPGVTGVEEGLEYNVPFTHVVFVFSSSRDALQAVEALTQWTRFVGPVTPVAAKPRMTIAALVWPADRA